MKVRERLNQIDTELSQKGKKGILIGYFAENYTAVKNEDIENYRHQAMEIIIANEVEDHFNIEGTELYLRQEYTGDRLKEFHGNKKSFPYWENKEEEHILDVSFPNIDKRFNEKSGLYVPGDLFLARMKMRPEFAEKYKDQILPTHAIKADSLKMLTAYIKDLRLVFAKFYGERDSIHKVHVRPLTAYEKSIFAGENLEV